MKKSKTDTEELDKSIFLRMIEFGIDKPNGFTFKEINNAIEPSGWEYLILEKYLHEAYLNALNRRVANAAATIETPFFVIQSGGNDYLSDNYKYIISYDSHFKYLDYQELKFARQNAKEARILSERAIRISIGAIIVSVFIPFVIAVFMTQSVKVEQEQINSIESVIKSLNN